MDGIIYSSSAAADPRSKRISRVGVAHKLHDLVRFLNQNNSEQLSDHQVDGWRFRERIKTILWFTSTVRFTIDFNVQIAAIKCVRKPGRGYDKLWSRYVWYISVFPIENGTVPIRRMKTLKTIHPRRRKRGVPTRGNLVVWFMCGIKRSPDLFGFLSHDWYLHWV